MKIFIIKGFFLSLNREKPIKNLLELLERLLAVKKALQSFKGEHELVVY